MNISVSILGFCVSFRAAFLVELSIFLVVFLIAAYEDYTQRSISGELCIVILVLLGLDSLIYSNIGGIILTALAVIFIYALPSINAIGDADVLIFLSYFVLFAKPVSSPKLAAVGSFCLIVSFLLLTLFVMITTRSAKSLDQKVQALLVMPPFLLQTIIVVAVFPAIVAI